MKKGLVVLAIIVGVILIGNVLIASAQGNGPATGGSLGFGMPGNTGTYTNTMPMGDMMGGGNHAQLHDAMTAAGGMHEQIWTAVAQKLGLTYAELNTALQNGQTIEQLAQAHGVTLADLNQTANAARQAALTDLVKQGVLTQAQADWMLNAMPTTMPMFTPGSFSQMHGGQPGSMMNGTGNTGGMMGGRGTMHGASSTGRQG